MNAKPSTPFGLLALSGWILALSLLGFIFHLYLRRNLESTTELVHGRWEATVQMRASQIATNPWQDPRSLYIFAGDSQIELTNWYELYQGRYAIRNCGLSSATINDVAKIIGSVPDQQVKCLVLLCGINDLLRNRTIEISSSDYDALISQAIDSQHYQRILVISLLPVNGSWPTPGIEGINEKVAAFNHRLSEICSNRNISFIDANSIIKGTHAALDPALTTDGLHLNKAGYQRVADAIAPSIFGSQQK